MKIVGYVLSYLGLAYVIARLGILMVSTVSLMAVPLRPPASSPAPALFPLLVHPGDYQTLTGSVSRREGMYPMASRPASLSSR
jgi:hypothetical protein